MTTLMPDLPMVLIADDDRSGREIIKMALEAWGYGVWVAEDGEEAYSITRDRAPRVVLSDLVMPRLDGLALLRRLKLWDPKIPVILFTAYPSLTDAVSAMKLGASNVLTKPLDFNRLKLELEDILHDAPGPLKPPPQREARAGLPSRRRANR